MARAVDAADIEIWALDVLGRDLAYLGRAEEGLSTLHQARDLAEALERPASLLIAYVSLTDVLMMLGRPAESVQVGRRGLEVVRRYGSDATVLISNVIEALIAVGEWDDADGLSASAVRSITANYPYMLLMNRAELELGRGDFRVAEAHLEAALRSLARDRGLGVYDVYLAELALWERRWIDAHSHVEAALALAGTPHTDQLRVWFAAKGLHALAELAALARARRDTHAATAWLAEADRLVTIARSARGHRIGDHAECQRLAGPCRSRARPRPWPRGTGHVVRHSHRLATPPAPGAGGVLPLARDRGARCHQRTAHVRRRPAAVRPRGRDPDRCRTAEEGTRAARPTSTARPRGLEPTPLDETPGWADGLGLTAREVDVLGLVSRGYTNPDIADALFISAKTASVHVSSILRKLGVTNRHEARGGCPPPHRPRHHTSRRHRPTPPAKTVGAEAESRWEGGSPHVAGRAAVLDEPA